MALFSKTVYGNETNLMDNSDVDGVYDFSKAIGITWKLYGFGTVGEDEIQKVKPEKGDEWWKDEQYTILFQKDGTLKGHTFSNEIFGKYSINGNNLVIEDLWATEVGEEYDGGKYHEALCSTLTHIFEIRNDQLLLYKVGTDVTDIIPHGNVVFDGGKTTIIGKGVTIKGETTIKQGTEFEIKNE